MFYNVIMHSGGREIMLLLSGGIVKSVSGTFLPLIYGRHTNHERRLDRQAMIGQRPTCNLSCLLAKSQQKMYDSMVTSCDTETIWEGKNTDEVRYQLHVESQSRSGQHLGDLRNTFRRKYSRCLSLPTTLYKHKCNFYNSPKVFLFFLMWST